MHFLRFRVFCVFDCLCFDGVCGVLGTFVVFYAAFEMLVVWVFSGVFVVVWVLRCVWVTSGVFGGFDCFYVSIFRVFCLLCFVFGLRFVLF